MNVFISYRRSDTQHIAGRLAERLCQTPGVRKVFLDTNVIEYGSNFEAGTDDALQHCDVCLVLIGDQWIGVRNDRAGAHEATDTRIQAKSDLVRHEVALALSTHRRIIPVLVDGATMPAQDALPPDVRPLASINAVFLRHASFNNDLTLVEDAIFSRRPGTPISRFFSRHPFLTLFLKIALGVLIALVSLIILGVIHKFATGGQALSDMLGSPGLAKLLIILWLGAGGALAAWFALRR